MTQLTASDLIDQIAKLDRTWVYEYVSGASRLKIDEIQRPVGPVRFSNYDDNGVVIRTGSVTRQQLAKMAYICANKPNYPLHIDRIFSAGGNSRSALETVLAYTPHFFICYPQRVDVYSGEIITNLKHIMWCPDEAHTLGVIARKEFTDIIAEIELGTSYGQIELSPSALSDEFDTIEAKRTHVQMQIALIEIGRALNFEAWIARPDQAIRVGNRTIGEFQNVLSSLQNVRIFFDDAVKRAANFIDCIWFTQDGRRIPAIIEIEHSTGVTSGLTRMLKLHETMPSIQTRYVVVAPNDLRDKVFAEANNPVFRVLDVRYMPYSTVRELYGLIQKYPLAGVVDYRFIEPFLQRVVT